jgi:hypothetical protein
MAQVTLSAKNQIVIPREVREALGSCHSAIRGVGAFSAGYLAEERQSWDR